MRKLYLVMALVVSGSVAMAQKNDPAAKQVLDAVSAKFKTFNSVQAGFAYKVEDAKGKVMSTKSGNVWIPPGFVQSNGLHLQIKHHGPINQNPFLPALFHQYIPAIKMPAGNHPGNQ